MFDLALEKFGFIREAEIGIHDKINFELYVLVCRTNER